VTETVRRAWRRWQVERRLRSGQPLRGPDWVHLGIADGCNYRCSWCASHSSLLSGPRPTGLLPRRLFDELLEDLQLLGTRQVEFAGTGEPLMRADAVAMIRAAKEAGLEALLITNGALLTAESCDQLVDLGLDTLNVSLNAATDETHERIHCAPAGDRARIVHMLRRLRRARGEHGKPFLSISVVVEKENYREVLVLAQQVIELDLDHVYFAPLGLNAASAQLVMTREEDEEARGLVQAADALMRAAGKHTNAAAFLDRPVEVYWTKELFSRVPCHVGQLYSRVAANGDIHPCAAARGRTSGNLAEMRFRDIWRSEAYRQFRREARRLPRSHQPVEGCLCWTCGQHFLTKQYEQQVRLGQLAPDGARA
jgi:pyrroloquinoline quinone biosynthesis protein E